MAKKIKIEELKALIEKETYQRVEQTTMTICILHLTSGFTIEGTSGTIDPEGFDAELGKQYAYEDALNKLWKLEGYHRVRFIEDAKNLIGEPQEKLFTLYK